MVEPTTIVLGIIFLLIVLIIVVGFFYFNKSRPSTALITTFGLTIKTPGGLYMSMENISIITSPIDVKIFPVMALKPLAQNQDAEPTQGWILKRPTFDPNSNIVTFFNPSNSGYMNYTVDANGNIVDGVITIYGENIPPDPIAGDPASFLGWFEMNQNNNITTFKSLFPGQIKGQDQYIIPGTERQISANPNVLPVTIGLPTGTNNQWIVG